MASLLLILVAVVLLVIGLAGGSSPLLATSIAASLLAALALVAGTRRVAARRAAAERPDVAASSGHVPHAGTGAPAGPGIPAQHTPGREGSDGGWRQPATSLSADAGEPDDASAEPDQAMDDPPDEPPALRVSAADAALVARLDAPVMVVDGRPRYHLADCPHLTGRDAEPLPVAEAVALGFTPCARCAPDPFLVANAGLT